MDARLGEQFGRNLWRKRRRANLTQEELGERVEMHRAEIGVLERGLRLPRLDTILKLSGGLEATPCELLEGLHWQSGYYVEGAFHVEDDSEWATQAEETGR